MNFWKFLEMDPTNDKLAVKKAYARLLRKYHPEDDAEGFQQLRRAYDMAIEQVEFQEWQGKSEKESDPKHFICENDEPGSQTVHIPAYWNTLDVCDTPLGYQEDSSGKALNELLEKTEQILSSEKERDKKERWENLFADPLLWNLNVKIEFSNQLFLLLYEKKCNDEVPFTMPFDVWRTIDTNLNWRDREIQLYRMVDESKAHRVMDPIWRAYGKSTAGAWRPGVVLKNTNRIVNSHKTGFSWLYIFPLILLLSRILGFINEYNPKFSQDDSKENQMPAYSQFDMGLESEQRGNYSEAAEWYRKAANRGHVDAQYNLGILYEEGRGVTQNYTEASNWYAIAARQGNPNAQYSLGLMYESGRGVALDYVEAYMWLSLSIIRSGMNVEDAEKHVKDILNKMTDQQRVEAQRLTREWKPTD